MTDNPLLSHLELTGTWLSSYALGNMALALLCLVIAGWSLWRYPERFTRPGFIVAVLAMLFYQWPLVVYSPLFDAHLPIAQWFAVSVHMVVLVNLIWVMATPQFTLAALYPDNQQTDYAAYNLRGVVLWLPIGLFILLTLCYFYFVPFNCTAFYAFLVDWNITRLVREVTGKLMAIRLAPHILNVLTSALCPMVAFLAISKMYFHVRSRQWRCLPLWLAMLLLTLAVSLLSGAKGALIPMAFALAVTGFLAARQWKWRIVIVALVMGVLAGIIVLIKGMTESPREGDFPFGQCVVELRACEKTWPLLHSLRPPDFSLGLTPLRIQQIEKEMHLFCNDKKLPSKVSAPKPDTLPLAVPAKAMSLLEIVRTVMYRAFVTPLQVANWHYMYVAEHGRPGFFGLPLAKQFSDHYVNVSMEVCQHYYLGGDKTSTCTAPTSYWFTYPAYLGIGGLLLAMLAGILFDVAGALVIKYSVQPITNLAIGLIAAGSINFMVSDFLTVLISHGAGTALVILAMIALSRRSRD